MPLVVRKLERIAAGVEQQPQHWTLLWFEDGTERAKVADYARSVGVPEEQLDWAE